MRLSKFLILSTFITLFSLLYVWQQTEIFRLAYLTEKNLSVFYGLLDKNTLLRYNIKKGASLVRIGSKISEYADFQLPDTYQLVRLKTTREVSGINLKTAKKQNIISQFFAIKREAQAKTTKP